MSNYLFYPTAISLNIQHNCHYFYLTEIVYNFYWKQDLQFFGWKMFPYTRVLSAQQIQLGDHIYNLTKVEYKLF